jgi:hypothetical protein
MNITTMTITVNGIEYKTKVQYFKEMGEVQRENETYVSFHRRCNLKYFQDIRRTYQDQMNAYNLKRYHSDPLFRKQRIECSLRNYHRVKT